jgi:hypothetical protein
MTFDDNQDHDLALSLYVKHFKCFNHITGKHIWERVQYLDWACLSNASIDTERTDQERFYAPLDRAAEAYAASKYSVS